MKTRLIAQFAPIGRVSCLLRGARLFVARGFGACCRRGRVPFVPVAASANGGRHAALQVFPLDAVVVRHIARLRKANGFT